MIFIKESPFPPTGERLSRNLEVLMKKSLVCLLCLAAFLFVASCASAPAPTEKPPVEKSAAPAVVEVPKPEAELKKAESLKEAIDKYGLASAKPEEYQKGNDSLKAGKDVYGKDNKKAKELLDGAAASYNTVIETALSQRSKDRSVERDTAKKKADQEKAARAASEKYGIGEAKWKEAEALFAEKKYLEAWEASGISIDAYNESYEIAKAKRTKADDSLRKTASEQTSTEQVIKEVSKEIESNQKQGAKP